MEMEADDAEDLSFSGYSHVNVEKMAELDMDDDADFISVLKRGKRKPTNSYVSFGPDNKRSDGRNTPPPNIVESLDHGVVLLEGISLDANCSFVAKVLHLMKFSYISVRQQGRNRVRVELESVKEAYSILERVELNQAGLSARIPLAILQVKGVIKGVHISYNMDEFSQADSDVKIQSVNRIMVKNDDGTQRPTETCVVVFQGRVLPATIALYGFRYQVSPYIGRVIQCFSCSHFSHVSSQCRSKKRCYKCGGSHEGKDCKSTILTCPNCAGPHAATDRYNCPRFQAAQKEYNARIQRENGTGPSASSPVSLPAPVLSEFPVLNGSPPKSLAPVLAEISSASVSTSPVSKPAEVSPSPKARPVSLVAKRLRNKKVQDVLEGKSPKLKGTVPVGLDGETTSRAPHVSTAPPVSTASHVSTAPVTSDVRVGLLERVFLSILRHICCNFLSMAENVYQGIETVVLQFMQGELFKTLKGAITSATSSTGWF